MEMHVGLNSQYGVKITKTDINDFLGNKDALLLSGSCAYFSQELYPVPCMVPDKEKTYAGFQKLYHDLIQSSRTSGFELVQKGRVPNSQLAKC